MIEYDTKRISRLNISDDSRSKKKLITIVLDNGKVFTGILKE